MCVLVCPTDCVNRCYCSCSYSLDRVPKPVNDIDFVTCDLQSSLLYKMEAFKQRFPRRENLYD